MEIFDVNALYNVHVGARGAGKAYFQSLMADRMSQFHSPLNPRDVANAVVFNLAEKQAEQATEQAKTAEPPVLHTPKPLGAWVDGKLKFQSRDHDAVRAYAHKRMRERHSVWLAPVGSFVTV